MKKWIYMTVATLVLAACSNEELPNGEVNNADKAHQVTVTATLPGTDSRVTLEDVTENGKNIIKVNWKESGEAFTVMTTATEINKDNEQTYVFTQTEGDEFQGTLPTAVSGQPYYAFYPAVDLWTENDRYEEGGFYRYWDENYEDITTFSASKVPFRFSWQDGTLKEARTLMYAISEDDTRFDFHHLTAIVKFTLTGLPKTMTDVELEISWENESSPDGVLDLTQTDVKAMYPTGERNEIEVETTASEGSCTFYAYLPPLAQGTTLRIECASSDENYVYICTKEVELQKAVEAGKFYRMARSMDTEQYSYNMTAGSVEDLKKWVRVCQKFRKGINLTLTADIDLTGADLDEDDPNSNWPNLSLWTATVDGNGHILKGLKRHVTDEAAMFAYLRYDATVKNLHLADVDFKTSEYLAAGIVADNDGTVEGCSVSGSIVSESDGYSVGGVVETNHSTGIVKGCYSTASVTGKYAAGGVVGQNNGTVTACYSTGALIAEVNIGGVVSSHVEGSVSSCYWDCTGATVGVGYDYSGTLDADAAVKVDGTTVTWETAMNAMNTALGASFGSQYVENTDTETKDKEPLKLAVSTSNSGTE